MSGPSKRRRAALPQKLGKIRQYLTDDLGVFPDDLNDLKNGHLLLLHINNGNSIGKTINTVLEKLSCHISRAQLQSLLNRAKKFKDVSSDVTMKKYSSMCCEQYIMFCHHIITPQPSLESVEPKPGSSNCPEQIKPGHSEVLHADHFVIEELQPRLSDDVGHPQPDSTPGRSVRVEEPISGSLIRSSSRKTHSLTPRKPKMKKRLEFVITDNLAKREKHKERLVKLRTKINFQRIHEIKYLNQYIARKRILVAHAKKDRKILELGAKYSKEAIAEELAETKRKLKNVIRNKKRSKKNKSSVDTVPPCECQLNNDVQIENLKEELKMKNETIGHLENEKLCLEETIDSLKCGYSSLQKGGKMYSMDFMMFVYDAIVNHVSMKNVPILIKQFAKRSGVILDHVPHRNTVEFMTRELGVVSDFQAAEMILASQNLTLGFDATTQEGLHMNSIHFTSKSDCHVMAIDQLPGGTAEDYELHVTETFDNITNVFCKFYDTYFEEIRQKIELAWNITESLRTNRPWKKKQFGNDCISHQLIQIPLQGWKG